MDQPTLAASLKGYSLIAGHIAEGGESPFRAYHPGDGRELDPVFFSASTSDVDAAVGGSG